MTCRYRTKKKRKDLIEVTKNLGYQKTKNKKKGT